MGGFQVEVGRTVFWDPAGPGTIRCPHCATTIRLQGGAEAEDAWARLGKVIDEWIEGGEGICVCPGCGGRLGLNDWEWSPPWGFGFLGFVFTDWPELSTGFLDDLAALLGHRLIYQAYKL
ncbi:hypothetical protein [Thermomonospora amylolytica]|uniref:hypothetical protein n=1 Tax=Thermomonospora amylolytica TaxID=1411117 RepID=UPI0013006048|nr:hypothetical protein [Thermomonospora amylolytica]